MRALLFLLLATLLFATAPAHALTPEQALAMASGENEARIKALNAVLASPDDRTIAFIQALADDAVKVTGTAAFVMDKDGKGHDPVSGGIKPVPEAAEDVVNNNEMRSEL